MSRMPGERAFLDDHSARFLVGVLNQHDLVRVFLFDGISATIAIYQRSFDNAGSFCELSLVDDDRVSRAQVLETNLRLGQKLLDLDEHFATGAVILYDYDLRRTLAKLG